MFSVEIFKISLIPKKSGLSFKITQDKGEIETSQSVNLYKASIVLSEETPEGSVINYLLY